MIKKNIAELFRYAIVSVFCAIFDYITFLFLYSYSHLSLISSYSFSYVVVSAIGFFGHVHFTFRLNKISLKNILYFVTQLLLAGIIGYLLLKFFLFFMSAAYAKLFQLAGIFFFSVLYGKFITFKK